VTVGPCDIPPDQLAVKPVVVLDGINISVIAEGIPIVVLELETDPTSFVAIIINNQEIFGNELKVAIPVPDVVGVTGLPFIVKLVVTIGYAEVPPDQLTVNPATLIDDIFRLLIEEGAVIIVLALVTDPMILVAFIINVQLDPANKLKVAVPISDVIGIVNIPLIV
jgi:hypothetical protein